VKPMKSYACLLLLIVAAAALDAEVCNNPAPDWTHDWEYEGIHRYYKLADKDGDGRFEAASIQLRNVTGKKMSISFVWKARALGDIYTPPKSVNLILEARGTSAALPELTISVPGNVMTSSNTCFAGFYADSWQIRELR
jgi:hypothetical protein